MIARKLRRSALRSRRKRCLTTVCGATPGHDPGRADGLEHDPELFYVTCLLHDLGVTDRYRDTVVGQACFAATAATIARGWSGECGWPEPRCTALADAMSAPRSEGASRARDRAISCRRVQGSMSSACAIGRWPLPPSRPCSLAIRGSASSSRSAPPCAPKPISTTARGSTSSIAIQSEPASSVLPYDD